MTSSRSKLPQISSSMEQLCQPNGRKWGAATEIFERAPSLPNPSYNILFNDVKPLLFTSRNRNGKIYQWCHPQMEL
jgi:hypothetical protein